MTHPIQKSICTTLVILGVGLTLVAPLLSKDSGNTGEKNAALSQAAAEMSEAASNFLNSFIHWSLGCKLDLYLFFEI